MAEETEEFFPTYGRCDSCGKIGNLYFDGEAMICHQTGDTQGFEECVARGWQDLETKEKEIQTNGNADQ